jgi:glutathione S-transferase
MKLYMAPGACSLSPHIVLREAGIEFEPVKVDLKTHTLSNGGDFYAVNPNGYIPALELDGGELLTEGPAIIQYLADLKPASKLAPAGGTLARARLYELLNFITTELHKSFGPLFSSDAPDAIKQASREKLAKRFAAIATKLGTSPYQMGDTFTVADAYLYVMLTWAGFKKVSLAEWPALGEYKTRVEARPAVKAALEAEAKLRAA